MAARSLPAEGERKLALVTGGAVRVGRAITLRLAESGYDVIVNFHSSSRQAETLVEELGRLGASAHLVRGDVSRSDDVARLAERVAELGGRLDLLVNNASIFASGSLLELTETDWDQAMGVNLKGPFLTVNAMAGFLRKARGSVVNIVDLSAWQPWLGHPHHSVSKAGLLQLTRVQARALAPEVRANAIAPGAVLLPEGTTADERDRLIQKAALRRLGSPEDVADAVLYLAGAGFVTGEVIRVDGGRTLGT
jgi:pteridine reductase